MVKYTGEWVHEWLDNLDFPLPSLEDYVRFDDATVRVAFANASRFPRNALSVYMRSLCEFSPSVFAAVSSVEGGDDVAITDTGPLAGIPSIVVAGDEDCLTPEFHDPGSRNLLAGRPRHGRSRLGATWLRSHDSDRDRVRRDSRPRIEYADGVLMAR
jgi:hypothetical protein